MTKIVLLFLIVVFAITLGYAIKKHKTKLYNKFKQIINQLNIDLKEEIDKIAEAYKEQ